MPSLHEVPSKVQRSVDELISGERLNIQQFYTRLRDPELVLSWEFMKTVTPEWGAFVPLDVHGETVAYVKLDKILRPSKTPWLFMPDAPSAGGKTTLVRLLARECTDCVRMIRTCTTRDLQPDEESFAATEVLIENPSIEARVSPQYYHVSQEQFDTLNEAGYFAETRPMWDTKSFYKEIRQRTAYYGIPKSSLEQIGDSHIPFWFLIVDEAGQAAASKWMVGKDINVQKWFILPTKQSFVQLSERITMLRSQHAAPRIVDAVRDLYTGAERADVVIPNPLDESGIPNRALQNTKNFLNFLRPETFTI